MLEGCPIDHSDDPELVRSFYRTVKGYSLPNIHNVTLQTVHRWFKPRKLWKLCTMIGPFTRS